MYLCRYIKCPITIFQALPSLGSVGRDVSTHYYYYYLEYITLFSTQKQLHTKNNLKAKKVST